MELDELADHAAPSQHLGHRQHQIGGRGALPRPARQAQADHFRDQHGDRLAQHGRLGLDAAHAPTQHGETVDHGGVAVRAHHRIGAQQLPAPPHHPGQMLQVDLVTDAGPRRHHPQVVERGLGPTQEAVAFPVARHLALDIGGKGAGMAEAVDLHRVIDHQVDGRQRVDPVGIAPQPRHGLAHGRQIDHGGHAGEVLHEHPHRAEGDLAVAAACRRPARQGLDVPGRHAVAVLVPEQVLQQDLERERQARDIAQGRGGLQRPIVERAPADPESPACAEAVERHRPAPSIAVGSRRSGPSAPDGMTVPGTQSAGGRGGRGPGLDRPSAVPLY